MSILELRNVEKIYGEKDNQVKALRNINLKVEEGEFVAIILSLIHISEPTRRS